MAEGEMGHFSVILQATINWEVSLFSSNWEVSLFSSYFPLPSKTITQSPSGKRRGFLPF